MLKPKYCCCRFITCYVPHSKIFPIAQLPATHKSRTFFLERRNLPWAMFIVWGTKHFSQRKLIYRKTVKVYQKQSIMLWMLCTLGKCWYHISSCIINNVAFQPLIFAYNYYFYFFFAHFHIIIDIMLPPCFSLIPSPTRNAAFNKSWLGIPRFLFYLAERSSGFTQGMLGCSLGWNFAKRCCFACHFSFWEAERLMKRFGKGMKWRGSRVNGGRYAIKMIKRVEWRDVCHV